MPPDLSFERAERGIVCGIDEVGRGPLAGPVVAAAVILPPTIPELLLSELDDSKKLSAKKRNALFDVIVDTAKVGLGRAEVAEIDSINILKATFLAMSRALAELQQIANLEVDCALVDGNQKPPLPCRIQCIVKGDGRSLSIAAASVVAKVTRDRMMEEMAREFPGYGWERNAGYGTPEHQQAIRRLGITPHHRKSFMPMADLFGNP